MEDPDNTKLYLKEASEFSFVTDMSGATGLKGVTGSKGDSGYIKIGTVIKGHYTTYGEFVNVHPTGEIGDAYIVDGSYYYWDGTGWANAGSIKGEKETLVINVLKAILVRKAVKETKVRLD